LQVINKKALEANDGKPLPLYQKALCGLAAGGLGALVGTPADLTLIRMQAGAHHIVLLWLVWFPLYPGSFQHSAILTLLLFFGSIAQRMAGLDAVQACLFFFCSRES
jgi:hypothetical protein